MSRVSDERGIIGGFIIKTAIVLAVLGLVAVEGGAILLARFSIQDLADSAATTAAVRLRDTGNIEAARQEAKTVVREEDSKARLTAFTARPDGSVLVTVVKRAATLLVHRIGFMRKWGRARATAEGRPPDF